MIKFPSTPLALVLIWLTRPPCAWYARTVVIVFWCTVSSFVSLPPAPRDRVEAPHAARARCGIARRAVVKAANALPSRIGAGEDDGLEMYRDAAALEGEGSLAAGAGVHREVGGVAEGEGEGMAVEWDAISKQGDEDGDEDNKEGKMQVEEQGEGEDAKDKTKSEDANAKEKEKSKEMQKQKQKPARAKPHDVHLTTVDGALLGVQLGKGQQRRWAAQVEASSEETGPGQMSRQEDMVREEWDQQRRERAVLKGEETEQADNAAPAEAGASNPVEGPQAARRGQKWLCKRAGARTRAEDLEVSGRGLPWHTEGRGLGFRQHPLRAESRLCLEDVRHALPHASRRFNCVAAICVEQEAILLVAVAIKGEKGGTRAYRVESVAGGQELAFALVGGRWVRVVGTPAKAGYWGGHGRCRGCRGCIEDGREGRTARTRPMVVVTAAPPPHRPELKVAVSVAVLVPGWCGHWGFDEAWLQVTCEHIHERVAQERLTAIDCDTPRTPATRGRRRGSGSEDGSLEKVVRVMHCEEKKAVLLRARWGARDATRSAAAARAGCGLGRGGGDRKAAAAAVPASRESFGTRVQQGSAASVGTEVRLRMMCAADRYLRGGGGRNLLVEVLAACRVRSWAAVEP
ncbi:hypothetical protein K438DRAFT_1768405 [Mycena galopus ATCC 62051]|nr:hypothetical protein K438DRAFT_1768405 [Mycena galopus ATCC 62051]